LQSIVTINDSLELACLQIILQSPVALRLFCFNIRQHGRQILYFKLHVDGRKFHYRRPHAAIGLQVVHRCFKAMVRKLFLIAYHLWVPYCQHLPPCSRKSQCAKNNSSKTLENQNWRKCDRKKMAVRKYYDHF